MTLKQEAYALIDTLPDDDSLLFFIDMIKRFRAITKNNDSDESLNNDAKRKAFLHMEEMKKNNPFPKDYDYARVIEEAVTEKYGSTN